MDDVVAVGPWWSADGSTEIDMVALAGRGRHPVLVGEAKWSRRVDGDRLAHSLARRAQQLARAAGGEPPGLVLCAREHVAEPPPGVGTITADDVFAADEPLAPTGQAPATSRR